MNYPEWQHHVKLGPKLIDPEERITLKAEAGLHYLQGNKLPYFSVTGETGGCIHREVLSVWPILAPVVALHLSDSDGSPMHAAGNAWYHLAGYYGGAGERYHAGNSECQHWNPDGTWNGYRFSTPDECLDSFANHVRVSVDEAKRLAHSWQVGIPYAEARPLMEDWIVQQAPRWKAEAEAACALLDSLK